MEMKPADMTPEQREAFDAAVNQAIEDMGIKAQSLQDEIVEASGIPSTVAQDIVLNAFAFIFIAGFCMRTQEQGLDEPETVGALLEVVLSAASLQLGGEVSVSEIEVVNKEDIH